MSDSSLKDIVIKQYEILINESKKYIINTNEWYVGMYLNIYTLYETYLGSLFENFVDIICGDGDFNILNLPLSFIIKIMEVSEKNINFLFNKNLKKEINGNKKHKANRVLKPIEENFQFIHFGKKENNEKLIERLNIILSNREDFSKDTGDWFSTLYITDRLTNNGKLNSETESIEMKNTKLVQNFFEEYSKNVRHKLAHEFIRGEKMENIKERYPIVETIKMFEEAIEKIDNQFNSIYGKRVELQNNENLLDNF